MRNHFKPLLLLGIGLAFAATSVHAKTAHLSAKKPSAVPTKTASPRKSAGHISPVKLKKLPSHATLLTNGGKKNLKNHPLPFQKSVRSAGKHTVMPLTHVKSTSAKNKPLQSVASKRHHASFSAHHASKNRHLKNADSTQVAEQTIESAPETDNTANNRIHSLITTQRETEAPDLIEMAVEIPSEQEYFSQLTSTQGVVQSSLFDAGQEAGLSEDLLNQLTGVFAWDIDFANNLSAGDMFTVVYGVNSAGGEEILSAEFVNRGRILTAIRYKDADGHINYYSPEGKTMRKSFLSTPVAYDRISSHFDTHRKHPILNRIRAHKGVDYAARTGTPVKSAGDGTVAFLGNKGGYGHVLIIKHGDHYETLYAHLSKFKDDLMEGDNVRQGQIIGYVGQTGLATGPHLHYEFRIDGVHSNPETVTQDNASTINRQLLADFKTKAQPLLAELYQTKSRSLLAKNLDKAN